MIRVIGQGEAGEIIFADTERSEPMTDLRCSCGFAEKIGWALERILSRKKGINFRHSENILCAWDNERDYEVECANIGDLPGALLEIAKMVKPPKPKERGWRAGDVVQNRSDKSLDIVTGVGDDSFYRRSLMVSQGLAIGYNPKFWRNPTIEAEKAGE